MSTLKSENTVYKAGGDIRLSLTTSCQSGCDFCHLEGHKSDEELGTLNPALAGWKTAKGNNLLEKLGGIVTQEDLEQVVAIARKMGLTKIHLTGGEPSLRPDILKITEYFRSNGFALGMTSHGETSPNKYREIFTSGLESINFSMHAVTPEDYLAMDLVAQQIERAHGRDRALKYAKGRLRNKFANVLAASKKLKVKINTVVQNYDATMAIVRWCEKNRMDLRLQRDLNNKTRSMNVIERILSELQAQLVRTELAVGDSSGAGMLYEYGQGTRIKVKYFGEVYVPAMCDECPLKGTADCRECFYGLRMEKGRVVTCIDVKNTKTQFTFSEFLAGLTQPGTVPHQVMEQYRNM